MTTSDRMVGPSPGRRLPLPWRPWQYRKFGHPRQRADNTSTFTVAIGDRLERVEHFFNLGVRMVQLTYNLRNLVGDGCTEAYQGGHSYFGRELVRALNEFRILVDVSHCSEQVGWDALEVSRVPIVVSHSASKAVCMHDRNKSDELAKAIADRGGFFGVVVVAGFIADHHEVSLSAFADHVIT